MITALRINRKFSKKRIVGIKAKCQLNSIATLKTSFLPTN